MAVEIMKPTPISYILGILITLCCNYTQAQTYGTTASAVWISNCTQNNFYNTSGSAANEIGPSGNVFNNANLGTYTAGSGNLILRGAQVKTFKDPSTSNVCNVRMFYRAYLQSGVPGAFTSIDLPFLEDCGAGTFPSGGTCVPGDQKWHRVIADGDVAPSPIDLTNFTPGNYVLEVYYEATGSFTSTSLCTDLVTLNNSGTNYKAFFSIQQPNLLISTNPTTCNGNEGSITLNGLTPGASYQLSYTFDGAVIGPATFVANGSGNIVIPGLTKGLYSNFIFGINGCTTTLLTGTILSNPIFVATFTSIPPFCAGTTPPVLPTNSNNGIPGTWSPSVVNNLTSGTYVFTPASGTCALPVTITINVIPRVVAVFPFGTSLTICGSGTVPTLPNTSTNGITGTWSPAVVDPLNSGTYIFTPTSIGCITGTTFTVTVNPNIVPTFTFPSTASICTGGTVPTLPTTSTNGITGTWSPAVVSTTTSGTYTFTPTAGQCATGSSYTLTVFPIVTPTFSFGTTLSICSGGTVPVLPAISDNGITGTWNPAVVSNTTSGTYTFTPSSNPCAPPATFTVTVGQIVTPAFPFPATASICTGGTVPTLPTTSTNGITGTWSPAVVSATTSGTYTFTPTAVQCALGASYTLTVSPIVTPTFSFGTTLSICSGGTVPVLPAISDNGITGTWSPAVVSNTTSGTYTFTQSSTPCSPPVTFTVTVNPIVTPAFPFGTNQSVCINTTAPVLPGISTNGITGTWSPAVVDNTTNGTYTFTPTAGQCANPATFTYQVNPVPSIINITNDTTVFDGDVLPPYNFFITIPGGGTKWTNSNPAIGLGASGSGTVPSFEATNPTNAPITGTITATPFVNGCNGTFQTFKITVRPLAKDIFVPNVFSPNGDTKNDILYVYGNYIASVEMHIFNQWGEHVIKITSKFQGWDGRYKGQPQPVGVYVYVLKAVMMDGTKVNKKGSITLIR